MMVEVEIRINGAYAQTYRLPFVPRVGDYIQCSSHDFLRVLSVHVQPESDAVMAVCERVPESAYCKVWCA